MKRSAGLLAAGLMLLVGVTAHAKARYKSNAQMIETAEAIAVVEITGLEKVSVKGRAWAYSQKASAKVARVLKGKLPKHVFLYGDEDFICASCHFATGRYLVFLDRDRDLLTGNNWHYSARKVAQGKVEWIEWPKKKAVPLPDVVREIKQVLVKAKYAKSRRT